MDIESYVGLVEGKNLETLKSIYVTASKSFVKELACLELGVACCQEMVELYDERKKKQLLLQFREPLVIRQRHQQKRLHNKYDERDFLYTIQDLSSVYTDRNPAIAAALLYFNKSQKGNKTINELLKGSSSFDHTIYEEGKESENDDIWNHKKTKTIFETKKEDANNLVRDKLFQVFILAEREDECQAIAKSLSVIRTAHRYIRDNVEVKKNQSIKMLLNLGRLSADFRKVCGDNGCIEIFLAQLTRVSMTVQNKLIEHGELLETQSRLDNELVTAKKAMEDAKEEVAEMKEKAKRMRKNDLDNLSMAEQNLKVVENELKICQGRKLDIDENIHKNERETIEVCKEINTCLEILSLWALQPVFAEVISAQDMKLILETLNIKHPSINALGSLIVHHSILFSSANVKFRWYQSNAIDVCIKRLSRYHETKEVEENEERKFESIDMLWLAVSSLIKNSNVAAEQALELHVVDFACTQMKIFKGQRFRQQALSVISECAKLSEKVSTQVKENNFVVELVDNLKEEDVLMSTASSSTLANLALSSKDIAQNLMTKDGVHTLLSVVADNRREYTEAKSHCVHCFTICIDENSANMFYELGGVEILIEDIISKKDVNLLIDISSQTFCENSLILLTKLIKLSPCCKKEFLEIGGLEMTTTFLGKNSREICCAASNLINVTVRSNQRIVDIARRISTVESLVHVLDRFNGKTRTACANALFSLLELDII